nr:MAG TPA: minor capsid protein [Caudoviricetes sp.]
MVKKKAVPNDKYWQDRAEERLSDAEKHSARYIKEINSVYDNARWKIIEEIKSLYDNYYKKDAGFDNEKLRAIVPNGTLKQFRREMNEAGLSDYLPENYKARMTRLEYLYAQCWAESKKANMKHYKLETESHKETIKHGYYKNIYDTAVGLKINPVFSGLNSRAVNEILNTQFVAGNYSKHIWKNTDKLARTLKEVIGSAVAKGEGYEKTARLIRTRFDVTKNEAIRLVRTETCYFQNQAEIKSLKEMGFKKYQFIATLDSRTSGVCRDHDKIVFDVDKAQAGFNLPPLHPNCRSTITAYLGKEYETDTRIARNENGVSEYVENINYGEWLKRTKNGTLRREPADTHPSTTSLSGFENTTIIKDEAFSNYARRLSIQNNEVAQKVSNIMYGKTESEVLSKIDVSEATKYKKFLDNRLTGLIRLTINSNTIRHLYKRGHLTGKALVGKDDKSPLKISDWKKLNEVFRNPDIVKLSHGNIQIDKWFGKKHLRLIVTKSKSMKKTSMITFFDRVERKKE